MGLCEPFLDFFPEQFFRLESFCARMLHVSHDRFLWRVIDNILSSEPFGLGALRSQKGRGGDSFDVGSGVIVMRDGWTGSGSFF